MSEEVNRDSTFTVRTEIQSFRDEAPYPVYDEVYFGPFRVQHFRKDDDGNGSAFVSVEVNEKLIIVKPDGKLECTDDDDAEFTFSASIRKIYNALALQRSVRNVKNLIKNL